MSTVLGFVLVAVVIVLILSALSATQNPKGPAFSRPKTTNGAQLRQDGNAKFITDRAGFLFRRRYFFIGTGCPPARLRAPDVEAIRSQQAVTPVKITSVPPRSWWLFEETFYWESGGYSAQDILALVRDRQRKEKARLDRAHMMLGADAAATNRRPGIPRELRRLVYERDGGACVECGATFDLQYDHVIPVALGGATSFENLQLLCGSCNQIKSANV